ncbi:MAG TPA: hypothetical protein VKS60_16950 [Stellaceae bacterium]|nr:hypothetical protein [Stellaceae bacterium]
MPLLILVMLGAGAAVAIVIFVLGRTRSVSVEEWAKKNDPVLASLFARNPGLAFDTEFSGRVPLYWLKDGENRMLIPQAEAENATVRPIACDLSEIPPKLVYPNREYTSCVEIGNDRHTLRAICFRTADSLAQVVDFYNEPIDPGRRLRVLKGSVESWRETSEKSPETGGFLYSYLLYPGYRLEAFVAYREEVSGDRPEP